MKRTILHDEEEKRRVKEKNRPSSQHHFRAVRLRFGKDLEHNDGSKAWKCGGEMGSDCFTMVPIALESQGAGSNGTINLSRFSYLLRRFVLLMPGH
ncbi:hypothetical protein PoB_000045500 [Plakobranchus ocellatus]|uniref:Uncharacterized protein n=1 Tax=Plakobranchus ocellatus TaxID=259542 RepID=A0AAV3XSW3_9GAST|nr:hypothetical protein PoB_000045500 [Plakobranchus ocellatus]